MPARLLAKAASRGTRGLAKMLLPVTPKEGSDNPLNETDIDLNPFRQFRVWYDQAVAAGIKHAEAMALATATLDGKPSARIVLLRGLDERGFVFFTNYQSRKASELGHNAQAAVVFYW